MFENTKAGDEVVLRNGGTDREIVTVKRRTPTRIIIEINGRERAYTASWGTRIGANRWSREGIRELTPELEAAVNAENVERAARERRTHATHSLAEVGQKLTDDQVTRIEAILAEVTHV